MGSALFTVVGLTFLVLMVRGLFFAGPSVGLLVTLLFVSLWTAAAWRMGRIGVFANDDLGVRSRSMLRTRTLPWAAIAAFEDRPATSGLAAWGANMMRGRAIWIVPKHGPPFQTALTYVSSQAEFLPPKPGLFNGWERTQGDMTQMQPLLGVRKGAENARVIDSEQQCRTTLYQLRDALRKPRDRTAHK